jgi:hypothetical protein
MPRLPWIVLIALYATAALSRPGAQTSQTNTHPPASATQLMYQQAADSAERKLNHIKENAKRKAPDQTPTTFTERELNTHLNSGRVRMPKGVSHLDLKGTPGVIDGNAQIDFDAITAGKRNSNPLLYLFSGVHQVAAMAHASGSGGMGHVHIDSMSIDGMGVPRAALEFFIERYLAPKYPGIGLDSIFKLPQRIDIAQIGQHTMTVTQK